MKAEPRWLTVAIVKDVHEAQLRLFGGSFGIRDAGLLESAVERPKHLFHYGENPSLFDLAATLCMGLVKNHPFVDGNKRAALLSARAFLYINGQVFEPEEVDEVRIMLAAAAGGADEALLARWFKDFSKRRR
ncbi:MAG: type II toxin-antitoxin system death-on-curing family toxin [Candidatus Tectomicrobia bacterium]|uniref:Type II toxin-antitoxin system death-on-curing family toxin n=1 Tax=Tectimicrobiota bacterium TaxID=2528274 RepID=A0A932HYN5_UNCTE|nr:type II toxin-antitoxin system death-on-curing family toxin [Candidatus Tectomicrobia bacterium]